jgi:hypothetical protein
MACKKDTCPANHCTKAFTSASSFCAVKNKSSQTRCLKQAEQVYHECLKHANDTSGMSAGSDNKDNSSYPSGSELAKLRGNFTNAEGETYNGGKLTAFTHNGVKYTVRRPGPRG